MSSDKIHLAGTFWSQLEDPAFMHMLVAKDLMERQTEADADVLTACMGRETTPLYRKLLLQPLTLRRSERKSEWEWPLPEKLKAVPVITNKLTNPTLVWIDNLDYVLTAQTIRFRENPFKHLYQHSVHDAAGHVTDHEVVLWMHDASYDENYLSDLWGAAVGLSAPSSEEFRELLEIMYEAMLGGTSRAHIERLVALFSGGALAVEDEIVEAVDADDRGWFVVTDKRVYRAKHFGEPVVSSQQQLKAGDPIFDTCRFYRAYDDIPEEELPALTLPADVFTPGVGALNFPNHEVPLIFEDGKVEFCVNGDPAAVKLFWEEFNSRRTPDGKSLADLLTGRDTVNPYKFVQQNVIRANCTLCVLKRALTPEPLVGIVQSRVWRMVMPPHEMLLTVRK
jgi:hypothetical protein